MSIVDQIRERQKVRGKELSSTPTLEQVLNMPLSEFAKRNMAIKINSKVLDCEIVLCSN
jgi:hypothetical protein